MIFDDVDCRMLLAFCKHFQMTFSCSCVAADMLSTDSGPSAAAQLSRSVVADSIHTTVPHKTVASDWAV